MKDFWCKRKQRRAQENEVFEKILAVLHDTNDWAKTDATLYSHLKSKLKIEYGLDSGYEYNHMVRWIRSPEELRIPRRFRSRFEEYLAIIDKRKNQNAPLEFLNSYLNREYSDTCTIDVKLSEHPEVKKWLQEQGINDFYINDKIFWFKNEEDAVACKLRWS